jgi:hypothetical protein
MEDLGFLWAVLQSILVLMMCFLSSALLLKYDGQIDFGLDVGSIDFENLLVIFLCSCSIAFLLVDRSQVEECCGVLLFVNCNLEIVNCSLCILLLVVEQDPDIEIGLEVLRVCFQGFHVVWQALLEMTLRRRRQMLDARGNRVQAIDVLSVQLENLEVELLGLLEFLGVNHQVICSIKHLF